ASRARANSAAANHGRGDGPPRGVPAAEARRSNCWRNTPIPRSRAAASNGKTSASGLPAWAGRSTGAGAPGGGDGAPPSGGCPEAARGRSDLASPAGAAPGAEKNQPGPARPTPPAALTNRPMPARVRAGAGGRSPGGGGVGASGGGDKL